MKRPTLLLAALFAALAGCATTAIDDSQLGLSKSSVFDTATPAPFGFEGAGAGQLCGVHHIPQFLLIHG